jgi:phytoene dehydrogenase-like protein
MTYHSQATQYDAIVVGAGPNGLAAAITLARAGRSVLVIEANATVGGATRSAELTLPGFVHDICSAIHPLGVGSPFFQSLPLHKHGLEWIHPPVPLAHPFDDGTATTLERSVRATGATLGIDAEAYWRLMAPIARDWEKIAYTTHGPLRRRRPAASWHASGCGRSGRRAAWPRSGFAASAHAVSSGEWARTRFCRWSARRVPPPGWCWPRSAMRSAGRSHAAARRKSRVRWPATCACLAARS